MQETKNTPVSVSRANQAKSMYQRSRMRIVPGTNVCRRAGGDLVPLALGDHERGRQIAVAVEREVQLHRAFGPPERPPTRTSPRTDRSPWRRASTACSRSET